MVFTESGKPQPTHRDLWENPVAISHPCQHSIPTVLTAPAEIEIPALQNSLLLFTDTQNSNENCKSINEDLFKVTSAWKPTHKTDWHSQPLLKYGLALGKQWAEREKGMLGRPPHTHTLEQVT